MLIRKPQEVCLFVCYENADTKGEIKANEKKFREAKNNFDET